MRSALICLAGFAIVAGTGCARLGGMRSRRAVQAAIEKHLKQRSNIVSSSMTLEVEDVQFDGDTAQAEVKFRSKQSPELVVGVRYVLRRAGDGWEVESSSPSGGMAHGSQAPASPTTQAPLAASPTPQASH